MVNDQIAPCRKDERQRACFHRTHTKGLGDERGGLRYPTLEVIDRRCASQPLSPPAGRDWQPPLVSNASKATILFSADASAAGSCISFTVEEFLECVLFVSWQVMSGAKRCNLQHTHSSVNQEQKGRKTNDTSVTYCGDKHNSPPHSKHWKHAWRLFLLF